MNKKILWIIIIAITFIAIVSTSYWLGLEVGQHSNLIEQVKEYCGEQYKIITP